MDCIFLPNLQENLSELSLVNDEINHLKAFHIQKSEIMVTNGKGLSAVVHAVRVGKWEYLLSDFNFIYDHNEFAPYIALAIGAPDNHKRLEFAVEKAVELGVNEIIPFRSSYSEVKKINMERLHSKSIAALIQCKRSRLPIIHDLVSYVDILDKFNDFNNIILCDEGGLKPTPLKKGGRYLVIIGPEGGLSANEKDTLISKPNVLQWKLGGTRLRAETAAISALTLITTLAD